MMLIVLGANGVTTKRMKFRGVTTREALINKYPDGVGEEIWNRLREESIKINWIDSLGQLSWVTQKLENLAWVSRSSMESTG